MLRVLCLFLFITFANNQKKIIALIINIHLNSVESSKDLPAKRFAMELGNKMA